MKVLIDMNLSPQWAEFLIGRGIEAEHWATVGPANADDLTIMTYAKEQDYVVLTHDLDFGSILAVTRGLAPSVVQIRSDDVLPSAIGEIVVSALVQMSAELEQ